jgi:hypothetical protein
MLLDASIDKHAPTPIDADAPSTASAADEKTSAADLLSSPLALHRTATSVAPEVTIRQVAPLVLVLTGATFLNVSSQFISVLLEWELN